MATTNLCNQHGRHLAVIQAQYQPMLYLVATKSMWTKMCPIFVAKYPSLPSNLSLVYTFTALHSTELKKIYINILFASKTHTCTYTAMLTNVFAANISMSCVQFILIFVAQTVLSVVLGVTQCFC